MAPERTPPSGEEVARRLSSLYDQAELATGNFNGTRALANSSRRPGRRGASQGSGVSDAAQEDLMRQWFDGARSRFGPSAPAALPVDRQQERGSGGARPKEAAKAPRGSSSDLPTIYELEQIVRPVAELTAAPMRELTAGPASEPGARPALELTAGPAAAPPVGAQAAPGSEMAVRAGLRAGAAPAAASQQSSPHVKKQSARRKFAVARELMARHMARQGMPVAQVPAIEYRPAAPQTGSFPSVGQTGSFPMVGQTGSFPTVGQTGSFPTVGQTGSFPSVGQTGTFPSVAQPTAFPAAPQTAAFPSAAQTGTFPSVAQAPAYQAAPQPTPYEAAPGVFDTGSMPQVYESAPPAAQPQAVILPRGYEAPAPAPEYTSVLLPLAYEKPTRPSGYQPAPMPPMSEPVPQPPAYEAAPRAAAYPPAPMSEPLPQPPAYEAAPRPAAYQSAPMPPENQPAPPPAGDAWRQSLRPTGNQQAWPAAPGAAGANPGFDIDSLVAGAGAGAAAPPVIGHDSRAAEAVAFARAQIGSPCVWGASGPGSYDPSGLTQAAWKSAGVMLPRATQDQAQAGPAVDLGAIQPGDLVFFHANVSHVGVYVGDGMMVHAPSPGARISEESVEYVGRAAIHSVVRPA
ncbi:NlpC/P60 family protein [Streptomyces sp. NPDC005070]